jgi:hypothetical protein
MYAPITSRASRSCRRTLRQLFRVSVLSVTTATAAFAQSTTPPTISSTPMNTEGASGSESGFQPSDLPAAEDKSWVNKPLLITGAAVLVAGYVPLVVVSQTSDRPGDQTNLLYPVVGPWMNLNDRGCDERACGDESLNKGLLIAGGVAQGVGALAVLLSLVLPGETTQNWYLIGKSKTQVTPMYVGNSTYGLGALGTF